MHCKLRTTYLYCVVSYWGSGVIIQPISYCLMCNYYIKFRYCRGANIFLYHVCLYHAVDTVFSFFKLLFRLRKSRRKRHDFHRTANVRNYLQLHQHNNLLSRYMNHALFEFFTRFAFNWLWIPVRLTHIWMWVTWTLLSIV